jgi:NUMOD4 motif-containing protein/HNH endonuclease
MNSVEIWKSIEGYEGLYEVSSLGKVKRLAGSKLCPWDREVNQRPKKIGYMIVTLSSAGRGKTLHVHRLVAAAFVPNPNGLNEVNHKDLDKSNNAASNLEWTTRNKNMNHFLENGERIYKHIVQGKPHPFAKNVFQLTKGGDLVKKWDSVTEAAKSLQIQKNNISACARNELQIAGGFKWAYSL